MPEALYWETFFIAGVRLTSCARDQSIVRSARGGGGSRVSGIVRRRARPDRDIFAERAVTPRNRTRPGEDWRATWKPDTSDAAPSRAFASSSWPTSRLSTAG